MSLAISTSIYAQKSTAPSVKSMTWNPQDQDGGNMKVGEVIGRQGAGYFAASYATSKLDPVYIGATTITCYSDKMQQTGESKFKAEADGKHLTFKQMLLTKKNTLVALAFVNDDKKNTSTLYLVNLDKKTGIVTGQPKSLITVGGEKGTSSAIKFGQIKGFYGTEYNMQGYNLAISPDSSKILVVANFEPKDDKLPSDIGIHVYDNDMNELWTKQFTPKYSVKQYDLNGITVDDDGNASILGNAYSLDPKKNKRSGSIKLITMFSQKGGSTKESRIEMKGDSLLSVQIQVAPKGFIEGVGLYTDSKGEAIKGLYRFTIDPEQGTVVDEGKCAFSTELLGSLFYLDKKDAKSSPERFLSLKYAFLQPDGSMTVLGEEMDAHSVSSSMGDYFVYHYRDAFAVKIDPNNRIVWSTTIFKEQETLNRNTLSSYIAMQKGDNTYFVYNDNKRNLDPGTDPNDPYIFLTDILSNATIVIGVIDKDGKLSRYPLMNYSDLRVLIETEGSTQVGGKDLVLVGHIGGKYKLGKVEVK